MDKRARRRDQTGHVERVLDRGDETFEGAALSRREPSIGCDGRGAGLFGVESHDGVETGVHGLDPPQDGVEQFDGRQLAPSQGVADREGRGGEEIHDGVRSYAADKTYSAGHRVRSPFRRAARHR